MPRSDSKPSLCPVHSYAEPLTTLKRSGVASFGTMPRSDSKPSLCPVHSYAEPLTTLKRSGVASFGTMLRSDSKPSLCPVHSYAEPLTTLKRSGTTAFSKDTRERSAVQGSGPAVHSYATPTSTLTRAGATAFAKDGTERGAVLTHGPNVHSYAAPISMLRKQGAVPFGSTASRGALPAMSRTGLTTAASTPNLHTRLAGGAVPRGSPLEAARHVRKAAATMASDMKASRRPISPIAIDDVLAVHEAADAPCAVPCVITAAA